MIRIDSRDMNILSISVYYHADQAVSKTQANHFRLTAEHAKQAARILRYIQTFKMFVAITRKRDRFNPRHTIHTKMLIIAWEASYPSR